MERDSLYTFLFIVYCVEIGVFLLLAPWSVSWDRHVVQIPFAGLRTLCLHPAFRSALSGFGAVHLLWGAHDLEAWLGRRRRRHADRS